MTVTECDPNKNTGFMYEDKYVFNAYAPMLKSGLIMVQGVGQKNKHIAAFIGNYLFSLVKQYHQRVSRTVSRSSSICFDYF